MSRKPLIYLVFLLTLLLTTGCYQLSIQSARDAPIQFNQEQILKLDEVQVIRHFYREIQINYVFGIHEDESRLINQIINHEAEPQDLIINLQIKRTYNALDVAVSLFSLGIYSRVWLIIEGDIIRL